MAYSEIPTVWVNTIKDIALSYEKNYNKMFCNPLYCSDDFRDGMVKYDEIAMTNALKATNDIIIRINSALNSSSYPSPSKIAAAFVFGLTSKGNCTFTPPDFNTFCTLKKTDLDNTVFYSNNFIRHPNAEFVIRVIKLLIESYNDEDPDDFLETYYRIKLPQKIPPNDIAFRDYLLKLVRFITDAQQQENDVMHLSDRTFMSHCIAVADVFMLVKLVSDCIEHGQFHYYYNVIPPLGKSSNKQL